MYKAYITTLKEVRKHKNADRLQMATVFGSDIIISLEHKEGELGVYFPTDGRLGKRFAEENNLLRKKDESGKEIGGYLDPEKRQIRALSLRGERSDGLWLPISSLEKFTNVSKLKEGDTIDVLGGEVICEKYVPAIKIRVQGPANKVKSKKKNKVEFPLFQEHKDTEQLMYNLDRFKKGDTIYITLKMHGTSQRTGYLPKVREPKWWQKLLKIEPKTTYDYVTGTRRVVINSFDKNTSFYGEDKFREKYHNLLIGKLQKGETIYYEVVGYTDSDKLIMNEANNKKTNDKEFIRQYGETTKFTYGCYTLPESTKLTVEDSNDPRMRMFTEVFNVNFVNVDPINKYPQNRMFVYRMTMTNEDGYIVEYPTELVQRRCEEMGLNYVTVFEKFIFTTKSMLLKKVDQYVDGPDPIGKTHVREGVVVRVDNRPVFTALKHKNFSFKVLEGLIKADAAEADMEESQ